MADPLRQTYGEVFFLTSGLQRDPYGLANFHPASNVNRLDIYLEDGVSTNVVMVNFKADGKGYPTSVFFPTLYGGTVQKVITGEASARSFAKYSLLVPPQVLQWNANGTSTLSLQTTVVQTAGDGLLGAFENYTALMTAHPATEDLMDAGSIAYVYTTVGSDEYGFYAVTYNSEAETYSWTLVDNPVTQINMVDTKQYNIVGMQIQKGNLPRPTSTVTISDEYIRYILAYIATVNDNCNLNKDTLDDHEIRITALETDVDAIIAGTQDITFNNTISGLVATTVQGAIDEIVGRLDTAEEDIVALEGRMDTAESDIDDLETFQNVTVPATYETIANADIIRGRTTDLENGKEDKSNKATDFSIKNDTLYPSTKAVGDYAVEKTANPVKSVTINTTTYVVTVVNYDDTTTTYDLPAEMAFVSASYDNDTKDITFVLQNGTTIAVPLDDIITGLATEAWVASNFYSKTELNAGQLDDRYYTEDETDVLLGNKIDKNLSNYIEKLTLSDNDKLPINDSDNGDSIKYTTFKHIKDQIVIDGEVFDASVDYATEGLGAFKTASTSIYTMNLQTGGDYRTTIKAPVSDTLTFVKFGNTSANANLLRVSLNNGVNYYNVIKNGARFKASVVSGQVVRLQFDGTQFIADIQSDVEVSETYTTKLNSTFGKFAPLDKGLPIVKEIQGRTIPALENMVTNGDFSDGTTGWGLRADTSQSVSGGINTITATATNTTVGITQTVSGMNGHIVYIVIRYNSQSANSVAVHDGGGVFALTSTPNTWQTKKVSKVATDNVMRIYQSLLSGQTLQVDYVMVFDLFTSHGVTATSGTAYDNAVADIEAMLALNGGYITTTPTTHLEDSEFKSVGKNLFDGSRTDYKLRETYSAPTTVSFLNGVITITGATSGGRFIAYNFPLIIGQSYTLKRSAITNASMGVVQYDTPPNYWAAFGEVTATHTFTATKAWAQVYIQVVDYTLPATVTQLQLEQGTTATAYEPYNTETQLFNHGRLSKLPNGIADKIRYNNGAYVLDRYVQEVTLTSGMITGVNTRTHVQTVLFNMPSDSVLSTASINGQKIIQGFGTEVAFPYDVVGYENKFYDDSNFVFLIVPLGTYANLAAAQADLAGTKIWYQLATPLLAQEVIDVDGTLIQESTTTVEQLQNIPTSVTIEYSMDVEQTTKTLVERDKLQQLEIDTLETRTTALEARKTVSHNVIYMSATAWSTYTRVDGEVYGVWNESTGVITMYYGTVGA